MAKSLSRSWRFRRTTGTTPFTTSATVSASVRWCTAWFTSATCRWGACFRYNHDALHHRPAGQSRWPGPGWTNSRWVIPFDLMMFWAAPFIALQYFPLQLMEPADKQSFNLLLVIHLMQCFFLSAPCLPLAPSFHHPPPLRTWSINMWFPLLSRRSWRSRTWEF